MIRLIGRFVAGVLLYLLLLPLSSVAAIVVPLFTRPMPQSVTAFTWGGVFGTYDNPPQGDEGWVRERSYYPGVVTGWRGYLNRVGWMRRNRLYGLKRRLAVDYSTGVSVSIKGNPHISDKYKIPGRMTARAFDRAGRLIAFEWYSVTPYWHDRCVRVRIGWKIKGDKFNTVGDFAPLVFTINPVDSYGTE